MNSKSIKSTDIYGNEYDISVSDLHWRPAAYAIVVRENKILLVKERGSFHMPGGGVDLGETPENAVVREVKEETGLNVTAPRLVGSLSTFFAQAHKSSMDEVAHVQSLLLYYHCKLIGGDLSLDNLQDDERQHGLTPEWMELSKLDSLPIGSTVDWRPIVRQALGL